MYYNLHISTMSAYVLEEAVKSMHSPTHHFFLHVITFSLLSTIQHPHSGVSMSPYTVVANFQHRGHFVPDGFTIRMPTSIVLSFFNVTVVVS